MNTKKTCNLNFLFLYSGDFENVSCVALTINRSWRSVKCDRKLPYICEILTSCGENGESLKQL